LAEITGAVVSLPYLYPHQRFGREAVLFQLVLLREPPTIPQIWRLVSISYQESLDGIPRSLVFKPG
jgi:hypothetical protein